MIYVFNGIGGSGKSSVVQQASKILNQTGIKTFEFSKAEFAKDVMRTKFGWDGKTKDHQIRKALCDLTDIATEYDDLPFKALVKEVEKVKNLGVVFTHIREIGEIKRFQEHFGKNDCRSVLVTRLHSDGSFLEDVPHVYTDSYKYVNNYSYDRRLTNAQNKLSEAVHIFLEKEIQEKNIIKPDQRFSVKLAS